MRYLLIAAAVVTLAAFATPADARGPCSTGGYVVVTSAHTQLMVGSKAVAPLEQGTRLKVVEVRGNWLATSVEQSGKRFDGWVWAPHVRSTVQASQVRTFSYEPVQQPVVVGVDEAEPYITGLN